LFSGPAIAEIASNPRIGRSGKAVRREVAMDMGTRLLRCNYQEFGMKNSSIRRKPVMPEGQSRRQVLAFAGLLPLAYVLGTAPAAAASEAGGIVMRDGWILRADDLRRLAVS
jgi:hypothetical protein